MYMYITNCTENFTQTDAKERTCIYRVRITLHSS